jgi:hypothetical protein
MKLALGLCAALGIFAAAIAPSARGDAQTPQQDFSANGKPGVSSCSVATTPSFESGGTLEAGIPLDVASADFTGDSHPDVAALELQRLRAGNSYYALQIRLSEGGSQSLSVVGPASRLVVRPMDVTGDGTLDLVVQAVDSGAAVAVFLNDGCGHFYPNRTQHFSTRLRLVSSDSCLLAKLSCVQPEAAARGPYTANFGWHRSRLTREHRDPYLAANAEAVSLLTFSFQTSRAPPPSA